MRKSTGHHLSIRSDEKYIWTGKPGQLQSTGLQRVGHDRVTELQQWVYAVHQYSFAERHFVQGRSVFNKNNYFLCFFVCKGSI